MLRRWDRSKPSWEGRVSGSPGLGVSSPGIDGDGRLCTISYHRNHGAFFVLEPPCLSDSLRQRKRY